MLISEAFELYRQEFIIFRGQSRRTEELSQVAMKSLVSYCGDIPLSELTFDHVRGWRDKLAKTRSQNTVRIYILKLRVVLAHFNLKGEDVLNPQLIGVPKRQTTVVNFLSPEEIDYLIECVFKAQSGYSTQNRYRNRAAAALLASSGIRVSECISLNIEDLKPDRTFTVIGKGDKMRLCFFDKRAEQYINEYLAVRSDNERALFVSERTGKRISKSTIEEIFKTATRRCGFPKPVTPHTMRHSFATHMLRQNTNLFYVSKFLGHASTQTTEMYTHYVDEDLKNIYEKAQNAPLTHRLEVLLTPAQTPFCFSHATRTRLGSVASVKPSQSLSLLSQVSALAAPAIHVSTTLPATHVVAPVRPHSPTPQLVACDTNPSSLAPSQSLSRLSHPSTVEYPGRPAAYTPSGHANQAPATHRVAGLSAPAHTPSCFSQASRFSVASAASV